jgi:hypothetical protein
MQPVGRTCSSWEFKTIDKAETRSFKQAVTDGEKQAKAMLACWRRHGAGPSKNINVGLRRCPIDKLLSP